MKHPIQLILVKVMGSLMLLHQTLAFCLSLSGCLVGVACRDEICSAIPLH
jgi:hypothetical protein